MQGGTVTQRFLGSQTKRKVGSRKKMNFAEPSFFRPRALNRILKGRFGPDCLSQDTPFLELVHNLLGGFIQIRRSAQDNVRIRRRLFTGLAHMDRDHRGRMDERPDRLHRLFIVHAEWIGGGDYDQPGIDEQPSDFTVPPGHFIGLPSFLVSQICIESAAKILSVQQIGMPSVSHKPSLQLPGEQGLARMSPTGKQNDRGTMPVLPRTVLDADFAFDPGEISAPSFLPQNFLIVVNQFRDDAAAGDIIFIDEDKPSGRFKRGREIERDRRLRPQCQLRHLILVDRRASLLLRQIHRVDNPVNGRHFAVDFFIGHPQLIFSAALKRTLPSQNRLARNAVETDGKWS